MIATVTCNTCGESGKFDVKEIATVEAAQELIDSSHIQSCPFGHHVELSDIHYTVTGIEEGSAPTDEEVIAKRESEGYMTWTNTGDTPKGIEVTGFSGGYPIANCGGKPGFWMDFQTLPSGKRMWYCRKDDYELRMGQPTA